MLDSAPMRVRPLKAALTRVTIIVVGAGAMCVDKRARLEHASPPAQVSRARRTTQKDLVRNVVWLEPAWVPKSCKKPLEGY